MAQPMTTQGLTPYIFSNDAPAAAEFYKKAFGASDIAPQLADDGKRYIHCSMKINGSDLFMSDWFPEYGEPAVAPQGFNLHLQVEDADLWWRRAVDAGCTIKMPLEKQFWGDIYGQLQDPYGILWAIGETPKE